MSGFQILLSRYLWYLMIQTRSSDTGNVSESGRGRQHVMFKSRHFQKDCRFPIESNSGCFDCFKCFLKTWFNDDIEFCDDKNAKGQGSNPITNQNGNPNKTMPYNPMEMSDTGGSTTNTEGSKTGPLFSLHTSVPPSIQNESEPMKIDGFGKKTAVNVSSATVTATEENKPVKFTDKDIEIYKIQDKQCHLYKKIIKDIEILKNSNLAQVVDIKKGFVFGDKLLLSSDKKLSEEIIKKEKEYNLEREKENVDNQFNILKSFTLENLTIELLKEKIQEIFKFIDKLLEEKFTEIQNEIIFSQKTPNTSKTVHKFENNPNIQNSRERAMSCFVDVEISNGYSKILEILVGLNAEFNKFFSDTFHMNYLVKSSVDVYWEFLKILVDISKDPIFSVFLPEFAFFDVERNIKYFKKVDQLDISNLLKLEFIMISYRHMFNKIKERMKNLIPFFIFESRYYLRRYLICCLSTIWESNILKLYMRINCFKITDNENKYTKQVSLKKNRYLYILFKERYLANSAYHDQKEITMMLFFQMDFDNFINSLKENLIFLDPLNDAIIQKFKMHHHCPFVFLLLKTSNGTKFSVILRKKEHLEIFLICYFKTFMLNIKMRPHLLDITFSNTFTEDDPKYQAMKTLKNELFEFYLVNGITSLDKKFLVFKKESDEVCRTAFDVFWTYFEDEIIMELIDKA